MSGNAHLHHHHHRDAVQAASVDNTDHGLEDILVNALRGDVDANRQSVPVVHMEQKGTIDIEESLLKREEILDPRTFPMRWVLMCLLSIGTFILYLVRVCISITAAPVSTTEHYETMYTEYHWTKPDQGMVLSAFYYGYMMCQWVTPVLVNYVGEFPIFFWGCFFALVFHTITPLVANLGIYYIVAARVLTGLFESVTFPAVYGMIGKWIPKKESTTAIGIFLGGTYFGIVFTNVVAALMVRAMNWRWVFYSFGGLGFLWAAIFGLIGRTSPKGHPFVNRKEQDYIIATCSTQVRSKTEVRSNPWLLILSTPAAYAIYINHFAFNWTLYMLMSMMPSFMVDVFNLPAKSVCMASGGPFFLLLLVVLFSTRLSDYVILHRMVSVSVVRRGCQVSGLVLSAVCLVVCAHVHDVWASVTLMVLAVGVIGLCISGYAANFLEIAPNHTPAVMAISNTIATIPGIVTPKLCGWLLQLHGCTAPGKEGCRDAYQVVFWITLGVCCVAATTFLIFAKTTPQIR